MNTIIRTPSPRGALARRPYVDVPSTDTTWRADCRSLAVEANAEGLFGDRVDWVTISLICREQLRRPT